MLSATIPAVRKAVREFDPDLKHTFEHVGDIVEKLGKIPAITLAYCFSQIENGHRRLLYAGIVRKYRLDPELTWKFVLDHDINRKDFAELYRAVFGHAFPTKIAAMISPAESIRDRMIHGKRPEIKEMWGATICCFDYCREVNKHLRAKEQFAGFGRMQGITGKKGSPTLDKAVSRLALVGLGLSQKTRSAAAAVQAELLSGVPAEAG
jgi:hypothetical protein